MTTGYYGTNFLLFANARAAGTLLSGTHRASNARGLPGGGGMLAAGIELHII